MLKRPRRAGDIDQIVRNSGFDDETDDVPAASNPASPAGESAPETVEAPGGRPEQADGAQQDGLVSGEPGGSAVE